MNISTRNQFRGTVTRIDEGKVNSEVLLDANGTPMVAIVTNGSVERLELAPGKPVTALVKASSVVLSAGAAAPQTSARNCLCGTVSASREGAVNGEVTLAISGEITITAVVTNESIRHLGLAPGEPACAVFKASAVILAVEA